MGAFLLKAQNRLSDFFMGKIYPIVVALIVTVGHVTETEFYLNILNIALAVLALLTCKSIRPLFITIVTFTYQVTVANSPATPNYSTNYFTPERLPIIFILGFAVIASLFYFILRNKLFKRINIHKTRLLLPALVLSLAFLLGGFGSNEWSLDGFAYASSQLLVYLFLFLLFYLGISEEKSKEELVDYLTYIALIIAYMIIIQMLDLFIFGDAIVEGKIVKNNINLGWATCNPLGAVIITLIPVLFLGAAKKKCAWLYLITAVLTWVFSLLTCSRNALLFGTLTFFVCFAICCFKAVGRRRFFTVSLILTVTALCIGPVIEHDGFLLLFDNFLKQGFTSNGRFILWGKAWEIFNDNMLFGSGFFTLEAEMVYEAVKFAPTMVHNTILEMLASFGLFGIFAYVYYRLETFKMFLLRPSLTKSLLAMSYLVIFVQSLLDVFVFCFYPLFFSVLVLAVACRICDIEEESQSFKLKI